MQLAQLQLPNMTHFVSYTPLNYNEKFWDELISYYPLIRHGPH
jgi:hypothetical protein